MSEKTEYMNLAWGIARDISKMNDEERNAIFGYSDIGQIIRIFSPNNANYKIFQYKMNLGQDKINVGDLVICDHLSQGIVTSIICDIKNKEEYNVLFPDGESEIYTKNKLQKTGKSIDILSVLEELIL